MENYLLSLKNIYRLLTVNDYLFYSGGVISGQNRKGLTLIRFWTKYLLPEWRNTPHGRLIWRTGEKRSRYYSELCNRKREFAFYQSYLEELCAEMTEVSVRRQVILFADMLEERHYVHAVFLKKVRELLRLALEQDPCMTRQVFQYLDGQVTLAEKNDGGVPDSWWAGYLMMLLSLHAIAGSQMADARMEELRQRRIPDADYLRNSRRELVENREVQFLTLDYSELYYSQIEPGYFFGREKEFYDLKELLEQGGRYLISGIGGVGKTELLRQLLLWCASTNAATRIAVVQYEEDLPSSMARCFRGLDGATTEDRFRESLYRLSEHPEQKTVLFVDNLNHSEEEDPAVRLLGTLSCTVFVSSRLTALEGFSAYEVCTPDARACALIFRSSYGRILNSQEKEELDQLVAQERFRHPLTLRMLGKGAQFRNWSVTHMITLLQEKGLQVTWQEDGRRHSLPEIYRRMYQIAGLSETQLRLARMFAVLPYRRIDRSFAGAFFCGFLTEGEALTGELHALSELGWLEETEGGFRMHPVVAESLRMQPAEESEFAPFWRCAEKCVDEFWSPMMKKEERLAEILEVVFYAAAQIEGVVSARLLQLMADAGQYLLENFGKNEFILGRLRTQKEKCRSVTDSAQITYDTVCMYQVYGIGPVKELEDIGRHYAAQQDCRTVSARRFCVFSQIYGYSLARSGQYARAQEVLEKAFRCAEDTPLKVYLLYTQGVVQKLEGFNKEAVALFDRCLLLCAQEERINPAELAGILYNMGMSSAALEQTGDLRWCLVQTERLLGGNLKEKTSNTAWLLQLREELARLEKDERMAVSCMEELKQYVEIHHGRDSFSYLAACHRLACAYNRAGQGAEALENQRLALWLCREYFPEDAATLVLVLNNCGWILVDSGDGAGARPYLEEALQRSENLSAMMRGEPAWNLSRAYRLLGDTQEERRYLEEALACFLECYGAEHKKTKAVSQRVEELRAQKP